MSKKKLPKVLDKEKLESKNTKELIGYLKSLHQCEESFELSDMEINNDTIDSETIYFKRTQKWTVAYNIVKLILNKREHIKK